MLRFLRPWMNRGLHIAGFLLALLGLIVFAVLVSPLTHWYAKALGGPWSDPKGDILIVLAGEDSSEGILSQNTYLRCFYAILAFRQASFRRVVVSGGAAWGMRDFLVYHGIPSAVITIEGRSKSTRESALFVRGLLAGVPGRRILVTSDYHAFRARRAFHRAGVEAAVLPFPDAAKRSNGLAGRMPVFITEIIETAKIAHYLARGWI